MNIEAIIASNVLTVGIVAFLMKLWVKKHLTHSLSKQLSNFKSELAKEVSLHTIQNTWNHTKKMELLGTLYEHMIDADFELKALLMNIKVKNKEFIDERASKFCEKYIELNSCLHKNELFLEQSLVDSIRDIYKPYFDIAMEAMDRDFDYKSFGEGLPDSYQELTEIGDVPRKRVVKQFREAAGISA